jgi:hypothetical protein
MLFFGIFLFLFRDSWVVTHVAIQDVPGLLVGYTGIPPSEGPGCCFCVLSVCFTGRLLRNIFPK